MSEIYFISDLHFGQKNILRFGNRHASSVEELFENQLEAINSVVSNNDNLWLLGDIFFSNAAFELYASRINGRKKIILGNHDNFSVQYAFRFIDNFYGICEYKGFWLSHCPMYTQELLGKPNIHGHIHDAKQTPHREYGYYNVNVDVNPNKYFPTHIDEIRMTMKEYGFKV